MPTEPMLWYCSTDSTSRISISTLQQLLQKFSLADLESEDLLLILVLYLMYRESGDKELLFILGGMLFL